MALHLDSTHRLFTQLQPELHSKNQAKLELSVRDKLTDTGATCQLTRRLQRQYCCEAAHASMVCSLRGGQNFSVQMLIRRTAVICLEGS